MKKFTLIICQFAPSGYRENEFQNIYKISSEKDYLEALKDGYLTDASNRCEYPLNSFDVKYIYSYDDYSQYDHPGSIEHRDLRYNTSDKELESFAKDEYKDSIKKFNSWRNKIKTLIPRIRNIKRQYDKTINDLNELNKLADKYGYELIKKAQNASFK